ncbi:peptidyl-prolyl cis-trans isomerase cyp65 [Quercus suber]|uniref:RING-type E3 ubiquitin transferase n=1 Tax=Quercus suber TaxID=58331 RepID=A0AAW0LS25_QUESU
MGKKQHSKDRMFITKTEWANDWGGAKSKESRTSFKRLPFYCCGLTFTPFEDPVCTADGSVFDIMHIIPYIRKFGKNPVTGAPLKQEELIPLTFHKNSDGSLGEGGLMKNQNSDQKPVPNVKVMFQF